MLISWLFVLIWLAWVSSYSQSVMGPIRTVVWKAELADDFDDEEMTPELRLQGARDWAESVQARFAERYSGLLARETNAAPLHIRDDHLRKMRDAVEGAGGDMMGEFDAMLTRPASAKVGEYDEPRTRELIQQIVDQVSETMALVGLEPGGRKLLVSSVPSGLVNAFCCANTWDDEYHHVFVDSDLLIFCASLAKIVATCFTRGVVKDGAIVFEDRRIVSNAKAPDIARRIEDMFAAMVFLGTVRASEPWISEAGALTLYISLNVAMERFVIAHELSHLMLGHLETASESVGVRDDAFGDTEATIFSHEAEFEADAAGAILATETAVRLGYSNALTSVAPYIFLKGIEVVDACQSLHECATGGIDSTHPSSKDWLHSIRAVMERHMSRKDPDGNLPIVLQRIDQLFYWIRQQAVAGIVKRSAFGMTPHERANLRLFERDNPPSILGLRVDPGRIKAVGDEMSDRISR